MKEVWSKYANGEEKIEEVKEDNHPIQFNSVDDIIALSVEFDSWCRDSVCKNCFLYDKTIPQEDNYISAHYLCFSRWLKYVKFKEESK